MINGRCALAFDKASGKALTGTLLRIPISTSILCIICALFTIVPCSRRAVIIGGNWTAVRTTVCLVHAQAENTTDSAAGVRNTRCLRIEDSRHCPTSQHRAERQKQNGSHILPPEMSHLSSALRQLNYIACTSSAVEYIYWCIVVNRKNSTSKDSLLLDKQGQ